MVYQALYGERGIWVRPASMWNEIVNYQGKQVKRFTYIEQNEHTLEQICADLCSREQKRGSIGLLGEKVLHAGLKFYFEPNSDFHEVKINGFVADICNAEGIIEIQPEV